MSVVCIGRKGPCSEGELASLVIPYVNMCSGNGLADMPSSCLNSSCLLSATETVHCFRFF